jgi:murein DD-endopeptidase MepM/ murein hydrolase activator NlpD
MSKLIYPVHDKYVTSGYGKRILNGVEQFHDGIDFVNAVPDQNRPGQNLFHANRDCISVADGVINFDYDIYDERFRWLRSQDSVGNMVILRILIDGKSYCFRYCHLTENIVKIGQTVKQGEKLGQYGDAGYSFGPHLHFDGSPGEYFDRTKKIDPTGLFV